LATKLRMSADSANPCHFGGLSIRHSNVSEEAVNQADQLAIHPGSAGIAEAPVSAPLMQGMEEPGADFEDSFCEN